MCRPCGECRRVVFDVLENLERADRIEHALRFGFLESEQPHLAA